MIIVTGHIAVAPGNRASYLEGCVPVVVAGRAADGCLDFALSADLVDDGRINVTERWRDAASLNAFRGSGPSGEQQAALLETAVAEYEVVDPADD